MTWVWDHGPDDQGELLVLLALADHADDAGLCWPSMASIASKARMSERNARRVVRKLQDAGILTVEPQRGRSQTNTYRIVKPDTMSARTQCPPGQMKHKNRTNEAQKPDTAMSAEPSRTINETSLEIVDTPASVLEPFAGKEAVTSFLAYRRKSKAGALTMTGAKRLAKHLQTINTRGGDAADALGLAEERGWRSVEADWYFKENRNGNGTGKSPADDPTLRAIARAASRFDA